MCMTIFFLLQQGLFFYREITINIALLVLQDSRIRINRDKFNRGALVLI